MQTLNDLVFRDNSVGLLLYDFIYCRSERGYGVQIKKEQ
jgi:hypothetical protein